MEVNIKVKLDYDFKTMKHYNYYNLVHRRKGYIIYVITALISLAVALFMLLGKNQNYVFSAVFGFLTLYFVYQLINFEKVIDTQITKFFIKNPHVYSKIITLNNEQINIYNPDLDAPQFSYGWEHINEIHDTPEYFFLMAYKSAPVIISKNPDFFIEGTIEELTALIMEKAQSKPFKKVEKPIVKRPITFVHRVQDNVHEVIEGEFAEKTAPESDLNEEQDLQDVVNEENEDNIE